MKPNTVVIGYYVSNKDNDKENEKEKRRGQEFDKRLPQNVRAQIMKFPDGLNTMTESDYVSILKDINAASKNLLIARKYEGTTPDSLSLFNVAVLVFNYLNSFEKFDADKIKSSSGIRDSWPHIGVASVNIMTVGLYLNHPSQHLTHYHLSIRILIQLQISG